MDNKQTSKKTPVAENGYVVEAKDEDVEMRCGYFGWTPNCLKRFNTPPWLLLCIMWFVFTQGKKDVQMHESGGFRMNASV